MERDQRVADGQANWKKGSKVGLRREEEGAERKKKEDRGKRVNKRKKRRKDKEEARDGKQACSLLTEWIEKFV